MRSTKLPDGDWDGQKSCRLLMDHDFAVHMSSRTLTKYVVLIYNSTCLSAVTPSPSVFFFLLPILSGTWNPLLVSGHRGNGPSCWVSFHHALRYTNVLPRRNGSQIPKMTESRTRCLAQLGARPAEFTKGKTVGSWCFTVSPKKSDLMEM